MQYKKRLIEEFNAPGISNMPTVTTLCQLRGAYVNLEYTLPNGEKVKYPAAEQRGMTKLLFSKSAPRGGVLDPRAVAKCKQACVWLVAYARIKLLDDTKIYISYQVEKAYSDKCYKLVADNNHLLVCEYGCNGEKPEIIVFKKRESNSGL